jgi:hypothetical protein
MIELRVSPLMLVALVCVFVAVGSVFAIGGADPAPLAFAGVVVVAAALEGLWFRARVTGDGVAIRSLLGRRSFRWEEGLRGTLRARSRWSREPVEDPSRADEVVLWTPDGRQRALPRSLVGFQALVADLRVRGRLTSASPPPTWAERSLRGLDAVLRAGWTFACLAALLGAAAGLGVSSAGATAAAGLVGVGVLVGWLVLSYAWDVGTGDRLLDEVPSWATTGATLLVAVALLVAAWTWEDRDYAPPFTVAGLAVAGCVVAHRVRLLRT